MVPLFSSHTLHSVWIAFAAVVVFVFLIYPTVALFILTGSSFVISRSIFSVFFAIPREMAYLSASFFLSSCFAYRQEFA